jgi:hypothetical protein
MGSVGEIHTGHRKGQAMQDDIRGEVAMVTAASRRLGLLLARELARHCCPLVICAGNAADLDQAAGRGPVTVSTSGRPGSRVPLPPPSPGLSPIS